MEEFFKRTWEHLLGRLDGPMWIRFVLQPLVSSILALRAAVKDARAGRPPFDWSVLTERLNRRALLREAWREISRVFVVAVVLDLIYQITRLRWIYPGQTLLVAGSLALIPYVLVRGAAHRVIRLWQFLHKKGTMPVSRKAA